MTFFIVLPKEVESLYQLININRLGNTALHCGLRRHMTIHLTDIITARVVVMLLECGSATALALPT